MEQDTGTDGQVIGTGIFLLHTVTQYRLGFKVIIQLEQAFKTEGHQHLIFRRGTAQRIQSIFFIICQREGIHRFDICRLFDSGCFFLPASGIFLCFAAACQTGQEHGTGKQYRNRMVPFHIFFSSSMIMPACTPRSPWVSRWDQKMSW